MSNEYAIIREFICNGREMVIVKLEHGTHAMSYDEWKWTLGQLSPDRWKNDKKRTA